METKTDVIKIERKGGSMPLIGDQFPEMEVQTTQGKLNLPDAFKGKWFILFSHPADYTPVCTTEFMTFASMQNDARHAQKRTEVVIAFTLHQPPPMGPDFAIRLKMGARQQPLFILPALKQKRRFPSHHLRKSAASQVNCSPTLHGSPILSKPFFSTF